MNKSKNENRTKNNNKTTNLSDILAARRRIAKHKKI